MAWPDSEEIERGVKEAGGDWEEARGLKLIHKFNIAILMGDPAGGLFIAVDKDNTQAMTRAVGVSHDDQVCDSRASALKVSCISPRPSVLALRPLV